VEKSKRLQVLSFFPRFLYQVPQAIIAFLESESYEDTVRKAISIGGDSDTIACIAGGIAEAFYGGVPQAIVEKVRNLLDQRLNRVVSEFMDRYCKNRLT
jgi:ADP-ribosylglycohydrolase